MFSLGIDTVYIITHIHWIKVLYLYKNLSDGDRKFQIFEYKQIFTQHYFIVDYF